MVIPLTQKTPQPIKSLTDLTRQLMHCSGYGYREDESLVLRLARG
jgi:hypothetical protein